MTGPDGFSSVEHLSAAAVTALVDNELSARAEHRAKVHLVHCDECRDEVRRQRQAAEALRHADPDATSPARSSSACRGSRWTAARGRTTPPARGPACARTRSGSTGAVAPRPSPPGWI